MGKFVILVMDSVGIGALPDADRFGDMGSDTMCNLYRAMGGLTIPNLLSLGLGNIDGIQLPVKSDNPRGAYGRAMERFSGKDTTGGHWEIAGLVLDRPFDTFPNGFPRNILDPFEAAIGAKTLGNKAASGTEIIEELGEEHLKTGYPIVYTSADSVFQIACHEEVVPREQLYEMCRIAREILTDPYYVGRVIARPFTGKPGSFIRTPGRRDFSLLPPGDTILDAISQKGYEVAAVGKIEDIFANRGITKSNHTTDNMAGVDATIQYLKEDFSGLIFTNLVDFDSLYGHRNNAAGYAKALEELDARIPELLSALRPGDILLITADHGCDPTTLDSTDHSREYIPILATGQGIAPVNLGTRDTFSDIGATAADYFGIKWPTGMSFYHQLKRGTKDELL